MTIEYPAIKVGDTTPPPRVQLFGSDGVAVNLTGATVVLHTPGEDPLTVTVADAPTGVVRIPRGSLAPPANAKKKLFRVEFEVTYSDTTVQTFPEDGYDVLPVWADLDDAE